jgi:hypothetical protein
VEYCDHKELVEKALLKIQGMGVDRISKEIEDHRRPVLERFARGYAGEHIGCGVTTTSAAERMNNMLKGWLGNWSYSPTQARRHFRNRLVNHSTEMANQRARARRPNEIRSDFGAVLEQEIHRKARQELDRAMECEVQAADGPNESLIVNHEVICRNFKSDQDYHDHALKVY